jgi:hypothetical protein
MIEGVDVEFMFAPSEEVNLMLREGGLSMVFENDQVIRNKFKQGHQRESFLVKLMSFLEINKQFLILKKIILIKFSNTIQNNKISIIELIDEDNPETIGF